LIHPAVPGTAGLRITGEKVAPKDVKKIGKVAGSHTAVDPDNPLRIVAMADGHVIKQKDGTVDVQSLVTIRGDVDYSTGNLDFVGSLIITGDVRGDFTVKVKGNLDVHGNMEDARIVAGGDVVLHKGCIGRGNGRVEAGGTIKVHHIMNQTISAAKDIILEKEAVNAKIETKGKFDARHAVIIGGTIEAQDGADILDIGNAEGTKVQIRLGRRSKALERLATIEKDLKQHEKQAAEVKDGIYKLTIMQVNGAGWNEPKKELLAKLQLAQKAFPAQFEALTQERDALNADLHNESDITLNVHGTVFRNVVVDINGAKQMTDQELSEIQFYKASGLIASRPL
jgi:hypothetical protein